jgi:hypothetical protein
MSSKHRYFRCVVGVLVLAYFWIATIPSVSHAVFPPTLQVVHLDWIRVNDGALADAEVPLAATNPTGVMATGR